MTLELLGAVVRFAGLVLLLLLAGWVVWPGPAPRGNRPKLGRPGPHDAAAPPPGAQQPGDAPGAAFQPARPPQEPAGWNAAHADADADAAWDSWLFRPLAGLGAVVVSLALLAVVLPLRGALVVLALAAADVAVGGWHRG